MVHCAKKDLGLSEDDYRAILEQVTGHSSARDCSDGQLGLVVDRLRARGWRPKKGGKRSNDPAVRKIWALWAALGELGALRTPTRQGLRQFCRSQVQVEDPEWLSPAQARQIIEALKDWKARAERQKKEQGA